MQREIVQLDNPVLRQKAQELSLYEIKSADIQKIIAFMRETMRNAPGVGLAAPQVGVPLQLAVIEDSNERIEGLEENIRKERGREVIKFHVIINPKIKILDSSTNLFFESCLSVRGISRITPRAKKIEVECLNENGDKKIITASGWYARILQHEIDHLNGKLYIDIADKRTEITNNEENRKKWLNASAKEINQHYEEALAKKNYNTNR
jgi:peptide deformylase